MSESEQRQLGRIETMLSGLIDKVDERHEEDTKWKAEIHLILHGDGNGHKGHNVRIDRLEQAKANRTWLERAVILALIGLIVERAFVAFTG